MIGCEKGVLTTDFLVSFLCLSFIVSYLMVTASYRMDYANEERILTDLRVLMDELAGKINLVLAGGPGHEVIFTTPTSIHGSRYQLWVNSTGVYGMVNGRYGRSLIYPTTVVDSSGNPRRIMLRPGLTYSIKNLKRGNGTIIMITEAK
ncbi:MAG TPA: hypothetical protein HA298_00930 [Methanobacteriales archaeon]|nr:hypothetical protein [Methanobacteriaceae archaeon]MBC7089490.1 hypothetical protein [Methanobacteriaceae archaeon]MBC7096459.1 hypothetical protein [Methanobacteriales archaeon]MDI3484163.1 hypothetical protein [Methanobacteriaceae archaeon]HIH61241.1 hypothetical protein [Methanobacteriales archaeon]